MDKAFTKRRTSTGSRLRVEDGQDVPYHEEVHLFDGK